jgi:hypothetical protein
MATIAKETASKLKAFLVAVGKSGEKIEVF